MNPLVFETSASTDSAIWALAATKVNYFFDSQKQKLPKFPFFNKKDTISFIFSKLYTTEFTNSFSANNRCVFPKKVHTAETSIQADHSSNDSVWKVLNQSFSTLLR